MPEDIWEFVIADARRLGYDALTPAMRQRQARGIETYGVPLTAETPIDMIAECVAEILDACAYAHTLCVRYPGDNKWLWNYRRLLRLAYLYAQEHGMDSLDEHAPAVDNDAAPGSRLQ